MNKLCIFIGMMGGSYLGWWLGDFFGLISAFIVSSIFSLFGIYLGWYINREYLE